MTASDSLLKNDDRGRFSWRSSGAGPDGLAANQRLAPLLRRAAIHGRGQHPGHAGAATGGATSPLRSGAGRP
jgi:hypothetical protein